MMIRIYPMCFDRDTGPGETVIAGEDNPTRTIPVTCTVDYKMKFPTSVRGGRQRPGEVGCAVEHLGRSSPHISGVESPDWTTAVRLIEQRVHQQGKNAHLD